MTVLTPILYADGALRLTDHGPRGGGLVLVHVASGAECTVAPEAAESAERYLNTSTKVFAEQDFNKVAEQYADPSRSDERVYGGTVHKVIDHLIVPAFQPFYHG